MIRRPPRSTRVRSSAASDVYKRQIDASASQQQTFDQMQPFCIDPTKSYTAEIVTNFGPFTVELLPDRAPQAVNNFVMLARHEYFDDTLCHRAIPGFVVQCG